MPDVRENRLTWNTPSSWSARGDEWSGPWGGTELMWYGTLLPRLHAFLPADTILELGPGHGRWTQYLKEVADRLVLVDLAEDCIAACRERFGPDRSISYHVNDGKSLDMIADRSIDLVFSFDSLVHAEADVLEAYLSQLATKLTTNGVGFIHHSNMGAYRRAARLAKMVPGRLRPALTMRRLLVNLYAWRAESTTAELFAVLCERAGLVCVAQEKIRWEYGRGLTDAISLFTVPGSRWERPLVVVENPDLMEEAARLAEIGRLYGAASFPEKATRVKSST
jgi:SAM-dependent methyltransferase